MTAHSRLIATIDGLQWFISQSHNSLGSVTRIVTVYLWQRSAK